MSSATRPAKVYTWAPTRPSGRVLGWLLIVVGAFACLDAAVQLGRAFSADATVASFSGASWPRSISSTTVGFIGAPVGLACEILWLIWQHRVTANLWARRLPGLRFTPGWAVGWWFVPFAWYVQPFRAVRELARRVGGSDHPLAPDATPAVTDGILAWWWITYLAAQLFGIAATAIILHATWPALSHMSRWSTSGTTLVIQAATLRAVARWLLVAGLVRGASALLAARVVWAISRAEDGAPMLAGIPPRPDL